MFRKTLGLALYRSGRPAEAIPVLERSLAAKDFASAPYDLFLLTLCHAKQNEAVQARVYFNRAKLWLKANSKPLPPADEELKPCPAIAREAEVCCCVPVTLNCQKTFLQRCRRPGDSASWALIAGSHLHSSHRREDSTSTQ